MLAILTSHPIQYQAPLWQALGRDGRIPFEVWYATDHGVKSTHDREFGKTFAWDIDTLSGYPYRFLDIAPNASPSSFWRTHLKEDLAARLRSAGATALWIQGWQLAAYWQAAFSARRAGAELWLRGESNDLKRTPFLKSLIKRGVMKALFDRVDRFLYIGDANRRLYERYGVPAERLYPAYYAVDNERFARRAAELRPMRDALRERWRIPKDAFCTLFCGKFIPKKNPLDVVKAAHVLHARGEADRLHLLFAGSGELGRPLRDATAIAYDADQPASASTTTDSAWRPPASFAGFLNQSEISNAYVAADCLVLPSDTGETWGLVVNEAMASGLPCAVSTACGCAEDLVARDEPGRTFAVGNVEGIASALSLIRRAPPSSGELSRRLAAYSFPAIIDELVQVYEASTHAPTRLRKASSHV